MTDPESKIQTLLAGNKEISKDYHMPLKMEQMRPMSFSTGGALIIRASPPPPPLFKINLKIRTHQPIHPSIQTITHPSPTSNMPRPTLRPRTLLRPRNRHPRLPQRRRARHPRRNPQHHDPPLSNRRVRRSRNPPYRYPHIPKSPLPLPCPQN